MTKNYCKSKTAYITTAVLLVQHFTEQAYLDFRFYDNLQIMM